MPVATPTPSDADDTISRRNGVEQVIGLAPGSPSIVIVSN